MRCPDGSGAQRVKSSSQLRKDEEKDANENTREIKRGREKEVEGV